MCLKELKFSSELGQVPNEHRHVPKVLLVKILILIGTDYKACRKKEEIFLKVGSGNMQVGT